ncbi:MAG: phosphomethylpyrimidine synthase ThiC [Candidatus Thermoplasmatota archaeon]|nr:phosphomethylpyrimidine synthase ThiC [Euryarchaeota archaeon]MBU4031697.1 phosphomethylpyrimidine synthase ThiC [Candidatus Thermoplasmatota archaeon]MBU4071343.1 phosphomethylpyrimidine synthase ThiC [Candidatus Thermoplasmatota archaeon]MBU4144619.1 phosphomethylpyrimidine synthase ThiC [Candidatus Thermoplasmatota archaeon]MBU4592379.1 phosphomethylpyrimidine synthase ThiC [Candidatus Thermoplasmatota archaeon]
MSIMTEAKTGIPDVVKAVAKYENLPPEKIARGIASGRIVIPWNPRHAPTPVGVGQGLRVKVNVNLGTSEDCANLDDELEKAGIAIKFGADTIMDLSTGGDIDEIRRAILKSVNVPVGSVPIYQAGLEFARKSAVVDMTEDDIFKGIETHAKDGMDFMTVHCGVTKESIAALKRSKRLTGVVSRGGSFLTAWILHNDKENPLYANYDYLLELANEYEFTLSLGDGFRPGCNADATDAAQISELVTLGECVRRARTAGVQAMVEGPGHVPIHQIEANVRLEKAICDGAPFYVLGPLVTDIAPGYDHITGAIGGALAAYFGADFLCDVSPSEHLCLPTAEDIKTATISSKIAAHAADITRGIDLDRDIAISKARAELDWDAQFANCLDPEHAKARREERKPSKGDDEDVCTMCGKYCAIKITKEYLK